MATAVLSHHLSTLFKSIWMAVTALCSSALTNRIKTTTIFFETVCRGESVYLSQSHAPLNVHVMPDNASTNDTSFKVLMKYPLNQWQCKSFAHQLAGGTPGVSTFAFLSAETHFLRQAGEKVEPLLD